MKYLFLALTLLPAAAHAKVVSTASYTCKAFDGSQASYKFSATDEQGSFLQNRFINEVNGKVKAYPSQISVVVLDTPDINATSVDIGRAASDNPIDGDKFAKQILLWDMENGKPYLCQIQGGGF